VNPNVQDGYGRIPLMIASLFGYIDIVSLLLDYRANPNIQNRNGWTALMFVSVDGYIDIASLLLDHGADPNIRNNGGQTACDKAKTIEMKNIIGKHPESLYQKKD